MSLEKKAREFIQPYCHEKGSFPTDKEADTMAAVAASFAAPYEAALRELVEQSRRLDNGDENHEEFWQALSNAERLLNGGGE